MHQKLRCTEDKYNKMLTIIDSRWHIEIFFVLHISIKSSEEKWSTIADQSETLQVDSLPAELQGQFIL